MIVKIHCTYNNLGAWCKNKNVKRKWYEIGGRGCMEYGENPTKCKFREYPIQNKINSINL